MMEIMETSVASVSVIDKNQTIYLFPEQKIELLMTG